jgi:urease
VVTLVELSGKQRITGGNNLAKSELLTMDKSLVMDYFSKRGFLHQQQDNSVLLPLPQPYLMSRQAYAAAFGPTSGDRMR